MSKLILPGALFTVLEKFESMTFSDWGRIIHLQFQVKTYYLSDANYPTDNPSLV